MGSKTTFDPIDFNCIDAFKNVGVGFTSKSYSLKKLLVHLTNNYKETVSSINLYVRFLSTKKCVENLNKITEFSFWADP